jgi:hypothetical protein
LILIRITGIAGGLVRRKQTAYQLRSAVSTVSYFTILCFCTLMGCGEAAVVDSPTPANTTDDTTGATDTNQPGDTAEADTNTPPSDGEDGGTADTEPPYDCSTISDLKEQAEGPVDMTLCDVVVTYVYAAGFFVQQSETGPATEIFVNYGKWVNANPYAGGVIDLPVSEYGSFKGHQQITKADASIFKGNVDLTQYRLDISDGVEPSEAIESRLVSGTGLTVLSQKGLEYKVAYGSATDVVVYAKKAPKLCNGATFDLVNGIVKQRDVIHQINIWEPDQDIANIDTSGCLEPPVYDKNNWGFESWNESDPPAGFYKVGDGFTATQESTTVYADSSACKLTWTSTDNQDLVQGWLEPVVAGKSYTVSTWLHDNDPAGRARMFLSFYDADGGFITNEYPTTYSEDSDAWTALSHTAVAPENAAYVRGFIRLYDTPDFKNTDTASVVIDEWSVIEEDNSTIGGE